MPEKPTLLYLHGVGASDPEDVWKLGLNEGLLRLGYPNLDEVDVIAPKYAHALTGWDVKQSIPPHTIATPQKDKARQNRRDFERRTAAIEYRLGRHDGGTGWQGGPTLVDAALALPLFEQAKNYVSTPQIRAQVLNRILESVPESGRLLIVGHSLGSVIAADLIRRLPVEVEVVGLITIGSPLASGRFNVDDLRGALKEPPTNLAWWVNIWNAPDVVAAHRGVSSVFPWIVDVKVDTKNIAVRAHASKEYLSNEVVAAGVGFALFGSLSKELETRASAVDIPVNEAEEIALLALRYAHLLQERLSGDQRDRFSGALRQVQANAIADLNRRASIDKRGIPSEVSRLEFDLSDPGAKRPTPKPSRHIEKDEAVILFTVLATESVIAPFDITIDKSLRQRALEDLSAEMGLSGKYGNDVFESIKTAQAALAGNSAMTWIKWGALGLGAVAIVVGTGGLALAAGPGLAGAAVITSALASFGPGGMIGGLLTAGTLVTAGGGGIAFGLASAGTSADTLGAIIERRLATAILRRRQELDPDPAVWRLLVETELEVRREHERLDEFSDPSSPTLKQLKRKIELLERALKYLRDNGYEPEPEVDEAA